MTIKRATNELEYSQEFKAEIVKMEKCTPKQYAAKAIQIKAYELLECWGLFDETEYDNMTKKERLAIHTQLDNYITRIEKIIASGLK